MVVDVAPRPVDARERLLLAAIDVFGQLGFAAASTRAIASAAGVNLQGINYYFGGKRGLYLAAADHIAERMEGRMAPLGRAARERLVGRGKRVSAEEAREMLAGMLDRVAAILFDEEWAPITRFVVREQMDPSDAFDRIYARVMQPFIEVAHRIVAILTGDDPRSARVRLRTLSLAGSMVFLRIAHATVQRQLGWTRRGPRELAAVRELIAETVASVGPTVRPGKARAGVEPRRKRRAT